MAVYLLPHPQRTHTMRSAALAGKIGICLIAAAAGALAILGLAVGVSSRDLNEVRAASAASPSLEVGPTRALREYGYVRVIGTARNITSKPLRDTEAVVELLDRNGKLLNVESALVESPAIQPREDSPFSVHLKDAVGAASYRVRFRTLLGPSLSQSYADR